jgi:hypothetical protein
MYGMENLRIKIIGLPAMLSSPFAFSFLKGKRPMRAVILFKYIS